MTHKFSKTNIFSSQEQQTPLHIASRLGNVDIVVLLLQQSAQVDAVTKDLYTALHIAAKEGQEEVAAILMEHGASLPAATKKLLHLAAKYGKWWPSCSSASRLLLTLRARTGALPNSVAKKGYTPLHTSAKKNQIDIAKTLLDYEAKVDAEYSFLHLASQEGHHETAGLLISQGATINAKAKNGLTPIHLCAQEDKTEVARLLVDSGADCDAETKAGYTPLHVAAHFGQVNMVKFLLANGVRVNVQNELGYSPLHQVRA